MSKNKCFQKVNLISRPWERLPAPVQVSGVYSIKNLDFPRDPTMTRKMCNRHIAGGVKTSHRPEIKCFEKVNIISLKRGSTRRFGTHVA